MFQIKNFIEFARSINEGIFDASDVWKFDPETPDSGDLAKFSFTAKVQHREGSGDQEIGNIVANFLINKLSTEQRFINQLNLTDRIPVMFTSRNTEGGFFTGGRGVVKGDIIFIERKFYDENRLKMLEPFKPESATVGIVVNGFKIYDEKTLDLAKRGATGPIDQAASTGSTAQSATLANATGIETATPVAAADPNKAAADKTKQILNTLMSFKFGAKGDLIRWLNAAMTVLDPTLKDSLIKNGVINDTYNNELAAAIQKIVGDTAPVTKITQDVATAIKAKLDTITTDQVDAVLKAVAAAPAATLSGEIERIKTLIVGLKQGDKNGKVGLLQSILTIMDPSAGSIIAQKGGIDNNYGGATAQALQIVLKTPAPIPVVTEDVLKALIEKISKLTPEQIKQISDSMIAAVNKSLSGSTDSAGGGKRKPPKKNPEGSKKEVEKKKEEEKKSASSEKDELFN